MKKTTIFAVIVLLLFVVSVIYIKSSRKYLAVSPGYKNATYVIDGKKVELVNGVSEISIVPGSDSKITTRYFGNEVFYDFDSDGRKDIAFLFTQDAGGSGTFYYVVVALNKADGYLGGKATLIGDRIAPQTTEVNSRGFIVVNYADRKSTDSFAVKPSIGKSLVLKLDISTLELGEVVQNFEGEADPSKMTLGMKKWNWISTIYNDGTRILPKNINKFSLTFKNDGTFSAATDCNGVGGEYKVTKNKIVLDKMMSTLMYCDGSQESDFSKALTQVDSFMFTSKGELVLELKLDSGTMLFN